jgi:hypothetical protein
MSRCNRLSENGKPFCLSSIHLSISTTLSDTSKHFLFLLWYKRHLFILELKFFLINSTNTVERLQSSVYAETFSNELLSQARDYHSDSFVEVSSFFIWVNVNGIITDFPKTVPWYTTKYNFFCKTLLLEQGIRKIDIGHKLINKYL